MQTLKKFYVYSKDGCGFCDRLTSFMDQNNVQYEKFTLGTDYTPDEFLSKFGSNATFPQVHYESQKIGGMKDTVRFLVENKLV
tara:strand:- start:2189 stop:2437 length:249 start_codon:yes stop_codon:yes gene_type:complete